MALICQKQSLVYRTAVLTFHSVKIITFFNLSFTYPHILKLIFSTLDKVVESMVKNFSEGTEYFKVKLLNYFYVEVVCSLVSLYFVRLQFPSFKSVLFIVLTPLRNVLSWCFWLLHESSSYFGFSLDAGECVCSWV